jgi:DNA (cytosine-5)-methyltransferase 1
MYYGSVCSGIEAASVAWEPLGWKPAWFSEIESFPSAVLNYHYPNIKNFGDMTKIYDKIKNTKIDLLVGGTPCQSFSLEGNREGLDDSRGNLSIEFCKLANATQARWVVWENVPGVLSSECGRDFGAVLRKLAKFGYSICYRVLDAQYFGVPQQRRRVFVVGYRGDWRIAAQVLFEQACFKWNNQTSQKSQGRIASTIKAGYYKCWNDLANVVNINNKGTYGRRLTPLECERLQGFPDNYTNIPNASDTDRYKAIGNSMAVPVMRWLGYRIDLIDKKYGGASA